jgi:hypothetical protein
MIFSSLFKTKVNWQHKDATVRISAINDELSVDNTEQLVILTDLINNDPSDLVRRAALIKVGSFDCYLEASRSNSQEKIKQFAAKQVHGILSTDHNVVISAAQKKALLAQQENTPVLSTALLEAWLTHEQDSAIMISLYQHISARKTSIHLLTQSFNQKQNAEFQTHLIDQVDDVKVLDKLIKKACNEALAQKIKHKLDAIQAAIEKPLKLTKQIQLVLAKLQALKDVGDYGVYKNRKAALIKEWQAVEPESGVFSVEELTAFNDKYQTIISQLDKLFIAKAENYQQQIIADKLAHDKQQDKKAFTQQLNQISQALTTAVFSSENLDEAQFKILLNQLNTEIKSSVLNSSEQTVFVNQVNQLTKRLNQIPEIAESVSRATHLISKISQLTLPKTLDELNVRQQTYNDWLKSWREIEKKTAGILPESIVQAQKQIVSTWQGGLKSLQSQQKELFFQHKKKLHDIKRLLSNGKYKVCFGLFKGVKETIEQLSPQQQSQLQRDFDQVNEKIIELSDWEHYIATPRKQELLIAIQALVDTPLDNPNEQATKVKEYRGTWNSLGHADEDVDKQLNEQFNQLCEQAFAPCRLFYAEQDKIREQHLADRQQVINKANELVETIANTQELDFKNLDGQLNSLQHQWRNTGEVDRNQYKKLQQQFKTAIEPIKAAIHAFHHSNMEEKQTLIAQAEALLDNDDVYTAIDTVKQLQQTWRTIGFAGNQQESKLWQKFRQVNDELFEKRKLLKSDQQAVLFTQQQAYDEQLEALEVSLNELAELKDNHAQLVLVKQNAEALFKSVIANKPVIKSVASRLEKIIKRVEQQIEVNGKAKEQQSWLSLFNLIASNAVNDIDIETTKTSSDFTNMTTFWQKRLQEYAKLNNEVQGTQRFDKTLVIEILGQSNSPEELSEQRMKIQVQLMQEQMQSGTSIDLSKLLTQWLMLGRLSEADLPLIERLKGIYCS